MVTKSIIDRILILAAVVCAAGLAWQLAVLVSSKGHGPAVHDADSVKTPPPTSLASTKPAASSLRVVYPEQGTEAAKTTAKVSDAPESPTSHTAPSPAAPSLATPAAIAPPPAPLAPIPAAQAVPPPPVAAAHVASAQAVPPVVSTPTAAPSPVATASGTAIGPPGAATPHPTNSSSADPQAPAEQSNADTASRAPPAQTQDFAATDAFNAQADSVSQMAPTASDKVASIGNPTRTAAVSEPPAKHPPGAAVNINNASVQVLDHLRGGGHIGQAIARHRPYRSIEELVNKRVLRRDVYDQIKHQIGTQ